VRTALILLLCLYATSCDRGSTTAGMISRAGTYASPDGRHTLSVTVTADGIVKYSVSDAATGKSVASGGGFSTHHRWFFHWDEQDRLWTYNSDTGPFAVHEEASPGQWRVTTIDASSALLASMPPPVRDHLPDTMKQILKLNSDGPANTR